MTSQINPTDIDGNYPIAGVSNNTQGMRDNFTNTRTNFQYAAEEITDLQSKALLKAALTGTTLDNNLANNVMYNAQIRGFSGTTVAIANTSGTINIDCNAGHYQSIYMAGNISLGFDSNTWPTAGTAGMIRTQITVDQAGRTMALPVAVSNGVTGIQGFASNVITFAQSGTYEFGFMTTTGGSNITIFDLNRPLSYYTNDVTIAANTVSTSSVTGALTVAGGVGVVGDLYVSGNVVGNLNVASQTFTGNLAAGNVNSGGQLSAAGNITGGNINTTLITASALSLSGNILTPLAVTSNITGGNILTAGNVTGSYFIGNGSQLTGLTISAGTTLVNGNSNVRVNASGNVTVSSGGTSNVAVFATTGEYVTGVVSASGNITGGNLITSAAVSAGSLAVGGTIYAVGTISAVGNITGGNIVTAGVVSSTGNITGNYFIGNGSQLIGVTPFTQIVSGTTQLAVEVPSGNIQATIGGTANVVVFTPTGINVLGNVTSLGTSNCFVGNGSQLSNVVAVGVGAAGLVSTAGNVTGGNIRTGGAISATGNLTSGNIAVTGNVSLTGNVIGGNLTTSNQVVALGNITGGNILSDGQLSTTANISGQYFIGNGSQLTGITVSGGTAIVNGNSNVNVGANGNVTVGVTGISNVAVFAPTGVAVAGLVSATGNVVGNYVFGNGVFLTGITPTTQIVSGTTQMAIEIPSGNMQATINGIANVVVFRQTGISISGVVSATGNVNGSNILGSGSVSATGNLTIGGIANIGGNILSGGIISATGNLTSGNIAVTGNVSLTGNVIAGNLTTSNQVVALGNITGGNIRTDGQTVVMNATAPPAGGVAAYLMSSTANLGVFFGSGVPTISAAKGSLYLRTDGSTTNNRMYVNTDGATAWTAVTTAI
jgi:hypothetical protein